MSDNTNYQENSTLSVFFSRMMGEIYWVEKHLDNVLHTMKRTATTNELQDAFDAHRKETQVQLGRIEQIFREIQQPANERKSLGMQGLFDEGWQVIDDTEEGSFQRDVALIIAAQKVEHYEIACYGSLINLAVLLGYTKVVPLLQQSLQEEKDTDHKLSSLAENQINQSANEEPAEPVTKKDRTAKNYAAKTGDPKAKTKTSIKEERKSETASAAPKSKEPNEVTAGKSKPQTNKAKSVRAPKTKE